MKYCMFPIFYATAAVDPRSTVSSESPPSPSLFPIFEIRSWRNIPLTDSLSSISKSLENNWVIRNLFFVFESSSSMEVVSGVGGPAHGFVCTESFRSEIAKWLCLYRVLQTRRQTKWRTSKRCSSHLWSHFFLDMVRKPSPTRSNSSTPDSPYTSDIVPSL